MELTPEQEEFVNKPLPELEEHPLHPKQPQPYWYGCGQPERPPDNHLLYDCRCQKCMWHAMAALQTGTLNSKLQMCEDEKTWNTTKLELVIERARRSGVLDGH